MSTGRATNFEFVEVPIPMEVVVEKSIPLTFPLWREESNWYQGEKALQLIGSYTALKDGLKRSAESMASKDVKCCFCKSD